MPGFCFISLILKSHRAMKTDRPSARSGASFSGHFVNSETPPCRFGHSVSSNKSQAYRRLNYSLFCSVLKATHTDNPKPPTHGVASVDQLLLKPLSPYILEAILSKDEVPGCSGWEQLKSLASTWSSFAYMEEFRYSDMKQFCTHGIAPLLPFQLYVNAREVE